MSVAQGHPTRGLGFATDDEVLHLVCEEAQGEKQFKQFCYVL